MNEQGPSLIVPERLLASQRSAPRGMGGGAPVYFPKAQVLIANGICYNSLIRKQPLPRIYPPTLPLPSQGLSSCEI